MKKEDLYLQVDPPHIYVPGERTKNGYPCWKPIPKIMLGYFTSLPPETDYIFFRKENRKYLPLGDFKKTWAKAKSLAGISAFTFHDTRRVSISKIVKKGSPVSLLGKTANWKNPLFMVYTYRSCPPSGFEAASN